MPRFPFSLVGFTVVLLLVANGSASRATADPAQAQYDYRVSWNGIPAASATVIVSEDPDTALAQLRADVRTNRVVDMLFNFRGSVWGAFDQREAISRGFSFHRVTGGRVESTRIEVDGDGTLVGRYSRTGRADEVERVDEADVLDPVAALLRLRHAIPPNGSVTAHELFTGETRYRIEIEHVGDERVQVPAGTFDAVKVVPRVWRVGRQDARVRAVTAWVTREAPHTILRVRSDVFIGAVYGDLTKITRKGY